MSESPPRDSRADGADSNVDDAAEFVDAGAAAGFASGADGYLARVFAELHSRDALCVLARGLGARALLAKLLRVHCDAPAFGRRLVIVLNGERDAPALADALRADGLAEGLLPKRVTNEQGSSRERAALYAAGGALLVTARILVVDLLSGVVDAAAIHGIVVLDAHLVHDATTEAFILRRGTRRLPPPARGPRGADPFR